MSTILPEPSDNPDGLHRRYHVTKANGEPIDPKAVYFVLRIDRYGKDDVHTAACRKAAQAYAEAVQGTHLAAVGAELDALVHRIESEETGVDGPPCPNCGLPQTRNMHPKAGDPAYFNIVGTTYGCLPCAEIRANGRFKMITAMKQWLTQLNIPGKTPKDVANAALEFLNTQDESRRINFHRHAVMTMDKISPPPVAQPNPESAKEWISRHKDCYAVPMPLNEFHNVIKSVRFFVNNLDEAMLVLAGSDNTAVPVKTAQHCTSLCEMFGITPELKLPAPEAKYKSGDRVYWHQVREEGVPVVPQPAAVVASHGEKAEILVIRQIEAPVGSGPLLESVWVNTSDLSPRNGLIASVDKAIQNLTEWFPKNFHAAQNPVE